MATDRDFTVMDQGKLRARLGIDGAGRPSLEFRTGNQQAKLVLGPAGIEVLGDGGSKQIGVDGLTEGRVLQMVSEAVDAAIGHAIKQAKAVGPASLQACKHEVAEALTAFRAEAGDHSRQVAAAVEAAKRDLEQIVAAAEAKLADHVLQRLATVKAEVVEAVRQVLEGPDAQRRREALEALQR